MGTYRQPLLDTTLDRNKALPVDDNVTTLQDVNYWGGAVSSPSLRGDGYGAGTVEDNVPAVTPDFNWTSPSNAVGTNDARRANPTEATLSTSGTQPYTCSTLRFSNFGFSIPAGSTILGVEVGIVLDNYSTAAYDWNAINLAWGASAANLSTTTKGGATAIPVISLTNGHNFWFGGSADLWGETSATLLSNVNTTDFGFVFQPARNDSPTTSTRTIGVAGARMVVHYSVTEAGNLRTTQSYAQVIGEKADPLNVTQAYAQVIGEGAVSNVGFSQMYAELITTDQNLTPGRSLPPIIIT